MIMLLSVAGRAVLSSPIDSLRIRIVCTRPYWRILAERTAIDPDASSQSARDRVRIRVRTGAASIERLRGADEHNSDGQETGTVVPGLPVPDKYIRTFTSVPQAGLDNRTSVLYTGSVVGGGTVVNGMFFNRGSAADYDAWERLGNLGWGWEGLLPYFKKVSFCSTEE